MRRQPKPTTRKRTSKAEGGLKGFTDARKTKVDLLKDVQTHVVAQGVKNAGEGREDHKIHVSELVKDTSCPRYMFYKVSRAERSDPAKPAYHLLEMIWAAGHQEHAKWQKWLQEMGDLWGTWKCAVCGLKYHDQAEPEKCSDCDHSQFIYDEVHLLDDKYSLVGHSDGAVPRLGTLVEVKSFSVGTVRIEAPALVKENTYKVAGKSLVDHEGLWAAVKRPLRSHLLQGLMYLWLAKQMGLPYEQITFVYENKTTQKTKAFPIKYSERLIRPYLDILEAVQDAVARGVAPKRPSLFAKESKPCSECPFKTMCWESSDDTDAESDPVPAGGSSAGGEATGRSAAVRPTRAATAADPGGTRRRHGTRRPRTARADDATDPVGRAPRRATRDGRSRRAVGRRGGGEDQSTGFARRKR